MYGIEYLSLSYVHSVRYRAAGGSLQQVDLSETRWDGDTCRRGSGGGVGPWGPVLGALGCCPCLTHLDLSRTGVRPEHLALLEVGGMRGLLRSVLWPDPLNCVCTT